MADLVFPLSALAIVLLVITPILTLVSRRALADRKRRGAWADFGDGTAWLWLMLPVALPLGWLLSAAVSQLLPWSALAACRIEHVGAACVDGLLLVLLTAGLVVLARRRGGDSTAPLRRRTGTPLSRRVDALAADLPALRRWPVWVVDGDDLPAAFTFGIRRPILAVRADFADAAFAEGDPDRLRAALLHEAAHARKRDVLRLAALRAAVWLNPIGRWLAADAERWRDAREAACDREAVALGADPLALAHCLVRAAGRPQRAGIAALCQHDRATLRLRVALLVGGSHRASAPRRGLGLALLAVGLVLIAPHVGGEGLLDHFHHTIESWTGHG